MDTSLDHLPEENDKEEGSCQIHYWQTKTKYRKQLLKCVTCQVCICIKCYKTFHTRPNLIPIRRILLDYIMCWYLDLLKLPEGSLILKKIIVDDYNMHHIIILRLDQVRVSAWVLFGD